MNDSRQPIIAPDHPRNTQSAGNQIAVEPIRLVVWDLDDTFWSGTLTEGGMSYLQENHEIVVELAKRGIISSICSKNEFSSVEEILTSKEIWGYFVFPSIDWTSKGPRLKRLIKDIQLRPTTVAFIDDNALNRAEAEYFNPGIRTFDSGLIPYLLNDDALLGKADPSCSRLHQYRVLQERRAALSLANDTCDFLRESHIKVRFEYLLHAHVDRIVELINRTNQLNFTKNRLPENADEAKAILDKLLRSRFTKAGLINVSDRYGDYGFCGFYLMHHQHGHPPRLVQFCFSCRILNMGIESWVYRLLGRPQLDVQGPVISDVVHDDRLIDWINNIDEHGIRSEALPQRLDYILLRGGCDIHTIAHYFAADAPLIIRELHEVRNGLEPTISHSIMLRHAICGVSSALREAAKPFGFVDHDFMSSMMTLDKDASLALWILSFSHDSQTMLYRYKPTGEMLPVRFYKSPHLTRDYIGQTATELGVSSDILDHLRSNFEFLGMTPDEVFSATLQMLLDRVPSGVRVVLLLGNEMASNRQGMPVRNVNMARRNELIRQASKPFVNAVAIALSDCLRPGTNLPVGSHYDREIYYLIYRHIMACVGMDGHLPIQTNTSI